MSPSWVNFSLLRSIFLLNSSGCSMSTWLYTRNENMKLFFSLTVNPTKALVSPVRAGNLASGVVVSVLCGRMSVTLQDESFHQASLLPWPCHLGKQMILMRDGSLSPGTKHTHCSHCATMSPLPPGSHRHRSLRKHTHCDGHRQVRNDMGRVATMIRAWMLNQKKIK